MERLRGRVMGEGVQLRSAKLTIGDDTFTHRSKPGSLSVALEDGTEVVVHFRSPTLGPAHELRDRWAELMDHPLAEPFEDDAPGPHVKVALEGVVVRGGDALVLEGEVERQTKTDGYRGSEATAITAIHPVLIGVGEDAEAWLDDQDERAELQAALEGQEVKAIEPSEPEDDSTLPTTWPTVGSMLGTIATGVGLGAWLLGLGYHVSRYLLFAMGLQLVISSAFVLARRRPLPWMKVVGRRDEGRGLPWGANGAGPALFVGWVIVLLGWLGIGVEAASYAVGASMVVGLSGFALAFALWWMRRADARAIRLLLDAKAANAEGWGRREGTLTGGSIRWDRSHVRRSSTTTQTYTDSEGRSQTREVTSVWYEFEESVSVAPLLQLEVDGERFTVDAEGGAWGTTEVEVDDDLKLSGRAREGDSLAVVGRLKDGAIRMGGPESLFLFSTREGSAVGAARRGLWMHRLAVGTLVLLGALGVVVGWINPAQDHLRLPARVVDSDDPAIEAGDECTVHLGYLPGRRYASEPHRCQGNVSCGGKTIYGGWSFLGKGYFDCDADDLTGSDGGPDDEDGSIELRGFTGSANHGDGDVTFRFVQ